MTSHPHHQAHHSEPQEHTEQHAEPHSLNLSHPKEIPSAPIEDLQTFNQKYIVLAIVVTMMIIGFLFLTRRKKTILYNSTPSTDTIQISSTPTPTIVPDQTIARGDISKTVTWLHYKSVKNDYTFQYPKDNYVEINNKDAKMNFCKIGNAEVGIGIYPPLYQKPIFETEFAGKLLFTVGTVDNTDNLSIDAWIQENCSNAWFMKTENNITVNSVNIDNLTGIMYTSQMGKTKDTGKLIIIPHNGKLYFIYGMPYENEFYNLMISTFKFL